MNPQKFHFAKMLVLSAVLVCFFHLFEKKLSNKLLTAFSERGEMSYRRIHTLVGTLFTHDRRLLRGRKILNYAIYERSVIFEVEDKSLSFMGLRFFSLRNYSYSCYSCFSERCVFLSCIYY
jgi:hypothetical protein